MGSDSALPFLYDNGGGLPAYLVSKDVWSFLFDQWRVDVIWERQRERQMGDERESPAGRSGKYYEEVEPEIMAQS